jgi:hypothetical protein
MTSQTIPRGHHPGPRRGEVLDTKLKLGAPCGFQCQDKTQCETKVLTCVLVREGPLGPRVPVNWRVRMPHTSLRCNGEGLLRTFQWHVPILGKSLRVQSCPASRGHC